MLILSKFKLSISSSYACRIQILEVKSKSDFPIKSLCLIILLNCILSHLVLNVG